MGVAAIALVDESQRDASASDAALPWPLWQRVLFRFFFVYLILKIAPWNWFAAIPGVSFVLRPYDTLVDWAVTREQRAILSRARHARAGERQRRHVVRVGAALALSERRGDRDASCGACSTASATSTRGSRSGCA